MTARPHGGHHPLQLGTGCQPLSGGLSLEVDGAGMTLSRHVSTGMLCVSGGTADRGRRKGAEENKQAGSKIMF